MDTTPVGRLERWAIWADTFARRDGGRVELCTCNGELVEELRSADPDLLRYLADRTRSDPG